MKRASFRCDRPCDRTKTRQTHRRQCSGGQPIGSRPRSISPAHPLCQHETGQLQPDKTRTANGGGRAFFPKTRRLGGGCGVSDTTIKRARPHSRRRLEGGERGFPPVPIPQCSGGSRADPLRPTCPLGAVRGLGGADKTHIRPKPFAVTRAPAPWRSIRRNSSPPYAERAGESKNSRRSSVPPSPPETISGSI